MRLNYHFIVGDDGLHWFGHVVVALSGAHSISGRGPVGRALDASCGARACGVEGGSAAHSLWDWGLGHLPPFYRALVGASLASFAQLTPGPPLPRPAAGARARVLWLTRGAGVGAGYAKTVARRCVNEEEVLAHARAQTGYEIEAADFGTLPFARQLAMLRTADIITGMHGAGFANIIFVRPSCVVLELCSMHFCPNEYKAMSAKLGLRHRRWQNTNRADDLPGDDTRVPPAEFVEHLKRVLQAPRRGSVSGRAGSTPCPE
ncbi:hypothetical protein T492DRAFT_301475 [Pavlovales sp. CCMP2436]|nr:hypothetical protein T492DRAFT_301475 [Pavlovales sp. CCMP2436]